MRSTLLKRDLSGLPELTSWRWSGSRAGIKP
jgi:hypothetical protein